MKCIYMSLLSFVIIFHVQFTTITVTIYWKVENDSNLSAQYIDIIGQLA